MVDRNWLCPCFSVLSVVDLIFSPRKTRNARNNSCLFVCFVVNSSVEDRTTQSVPPAPLLPEEGWPSGRGGGRAGGLRSSSGETGVRFEH